MTIIWPAYVVKCQSSKCLTAHGDKVKIVELANSGLFVKSLIYQSPCCGGGIATMHNSNLGSNVTFKTNFDLMQLALHLNLCLWDSTKEMINGQMGLPFPPSLVADP